MKKLIFLFLLTISQYSFSQNSIGKSDDISRITLNTLLPEDSRLPDDSKIFLENKLNQIITSNGLGGTSYSNPRFIISASINEINKEQISESLQYYFNLDVIFYIIDIYEKKIFNTISLNIKGVGNTKNKAYNDAIKMIDPKSNHILNFLEKGKLKIIEYYNTECDFIQKAAIRLAKQNKFDEALYNLELVPNLCASCYDLSLNNMVEIYKQKINFECEKILANVRGLINMDKYDEAAILLLSIMPNTDCYKEAQTLLKEIKDHKCFVNLSKAKALWASYNIEEASRYLGEIPVDSKCNIEASKLIEEVKKAAKERDAREWKLALKAQDDDATIRRAAIDAAKAIGVSYGKSQPKTIIYNNFRTIW
jgi:hypothetical protein